MELNGGAVLFRRYGSERKLYKSIYMTSEAVQISTIQQVSLLCFYYFLYVWRNCNFACSVRKNVDLKS